METQTFKGNEVYTAITIAGNKMPFKAGSRLEGQFYHVGRWGSRGFTCTPEFYKLWSEGELSEFTIMESSYDRENPATGEKETQQSATIMGWMTWSKATNLVTKSATYEVKVNEATLMVKHSRVVAMKNLDLTPADLKMLEEVV